MGWSNPFSDGLQRWFKKDRVTIDNILFTLHHQATFFILVVGVIFILGENYLDSNAIVCRDGTPYENRYCWLKGTAHIQNENMEDNCLVHPSILKNDPERSTSYYIWLPFVLAILMGIVKIPRTLWKNFLENKMIEGLVYTKDGTEKPSEKIAEGFKGRKNRYNAYFMWFTFCEILNIGAVILSLTILNGLLHGLYFSYGMDFLRYTNSNGSDKIHDPRCNLFPVVVACNTKVIGATGGTDKENSICILSNNLFNQYYFLVLWWWLFSIMILSSLGILYRLDKITRLADIVTYEIGIVNMFVPALEIDAELRTNTVVTKLSPSARFVLRRIARTVSPITMDEILEELRDIRSENCENHAEKESMLA